MNPRIILIGGIPGTGKTTLCKEISSRLKIPYFNKDLLESALIEKEVCSLEGLNGVGYVLMERIAISELKFGRSVILDCVASSKRVHEHWGSFKDKNVKYIECVCSDHELHKTRLESRVRNIPSWYELTWNNVENIRKSYEPCFKEKLCIDSIKPIEQNIEQALEYVSS